jgi:sarcosine oxidase subunit beta
MARIDRRTEVLVIGAGIAGASAAMFLAEAGRSVMLADRGRVAGEASGLNAGMIDAPGWGPEPDLEATLKMGSLELFRRLQVDRGIDIGFRQCGQLVLLRYEDWDWAVAGVVGGSQVGSTAELIDRRTVRSLEPAVADRVAGAILTPGVGRAEPVAATTGFARAAVAAGAELAVGSEVTDIDATSGGFVVGVAGERVGTDVVVVAAGPWCADVGRLVGLEIPIVPVRGQMWATAPLPPVLFHTIAAAESTRVWEESAVTDPPQVTHRDGHRLTRHLYGRQRANGEVIFGGDRVPESPPTPDPEGIAANHAHAVELLPFLAAHPPARTWAGLMPFSRDGRPLIGAIDAQPGLYVVGGLASSGFNRGPMAGRLVADLVGRGIRPAVLDAADPAGRVGERTG